MASPPYNHGYNNAISPPYPPNAQLPQQPPKRRQTDMPSSAPAIKRRKASMLSTTSTGSAHPLRQTSFPPESVSRTAAYSRSPSADTMVSGSVAGAGQSKKKRGRKLKGTAHENGLSADMRSTTSDPAGRGKRRASNASLEEEDDAGDETTAIQMTSETIEQKARDKEHQALLIRGFDPDQTERFEIYRSSRLSDAIVRRIVNQTLSQSVGAPIILAVKTITKLFAGELIEDARRIQSQWIKATGEDQTGGLLSPPAENAVKLENETRRGPLLPDHLREAIRRYKLRREGGLAGQLGLWQLQQQGGVERFGSRVKGKRLLK